MGMSVFAGLIVATSLAIFFVPSFFVMVEKYLAKEKKNEDENPAFTPPDSSTTDSPSGGKDISEKGGQ